MSVTPTGCSPGPPTVVPNMAVRVAMSLRCCRASAASASAAARRARCSSGSSVSLR